MKIDIYGDGISYVTDEVSSIPTDEANLSEENRAKFVTDLAAVSRGLSGSKNPPVRYKALLKEAAPNNIPNDIDSGDVISHVSPQEYYHDEWEILNE